MVVKMSEMIMQFPTCKIVGGKEMSLLNDLWYGNIDPQNRTILRNDDYKRILTTICEYEAQFREPFSSE